MFVISRADNNAVHDLLPLCSLLDYSPRVRELANLRGGLCVAIYRDSPSVWRSRLPWIVGGIIGAVLIIVVGLVLLNARSNQATADNGQASASTAIDTIAQSLDVFSVEYPKILKGTPKDQTGAPGAIQTALNTLNATQAKLIGLDSKAFAILQANLNLINRALSASPPADLSAPLADITTQLQTLRAHLPASSVTPTS